MIICCIEIVNTFDQFILDLFPFVFLILLLDVNPFTVELFICQLEHELKFRERYIPMISFLSDDGGFIKRYFCLSRRFVGPLRLV